MKKLAQTKYSRWLFVLPALLIVAALFVYPLSTSIYYSMTSKHLIRASYRFIGLDNYMSLLRDPNFYKALSFSLKWTIASLTGQLIVGTTLALALNAAKRFEGLFKTLLIVPWAFSSIVIAFSWKWILNVVYGFVPHLLLNFGLTDELISFFTDGRMVFPVLIFINVWFGAPLIMVNVLAALKTVPGEQYEAAKIDGASGFKTFLFITVPHIQQVVGLLVILRSIWIFNNFDLVYLLTGGGPANLTTTMPIYAYKTGWERQLLGRASAVTLTLIVFLLVVAALLILVSKLWRRGDQRA
ncbi:MAG: carbohydrate ABC transporter permease [Limnochordia bacterium]